MQIRKVIKKLQEFEKIYPSAEVSVGNIDILFIQAMACYYDGPQQVLIRDESLNCYNIIGAKYKTRGTKIDIFTHSIEDALLDNTELEIDYSELSEERKKEYQKQDEMYRQQSIDISHSVERDNFIEYIKKFCKEKFDYDPDSKGSPLVHKAAEDFYNKNLDFRDKMSKDILSMHRVEKLHEIIPSWNERRKLQWDREIFVVLQDNKVHIEKKL